MADVLASWLPTEPKNWKTAIVVIWLDNSSYLCQSCLVLVGTFAAVMERLLEVRITITRSVIDRSDEIYLPTGTQVVNKTWWKEEFKLIEHKLCLAILLTLKSHNTVKDLVYASFKVAKYLISFLEDESKSDARITHCIAY